MRKHRIPMHRIHDPLRLRRVRLRVLDQAQQHQTPRPEAPRLPRGLEPDPPVLLLVIEDVVQVVLDLAADPLVAEPEG